MAQILRSTSRMDGGGKHIFPLYVVYIECNRTSLPGEGPAETGFYSG